MVEKPFSFFRSQISEPDPGQNCSRSFSRRIDAAVRVVLGGGAEGDAVAGGVDGGGGTGVLRTLIISKLPRLEISNPRVRAHAD
jgi:hypothetical protein